MKLSEKQIHNKLDKYYKKHYGEEYTDEWYVNPAINIWRFVRNKKTINLIYNQETGEITEHIE